MAESQGLSSADLRKQAAVGTIVRNGNTVRPESDPLESAYNDARKVAATRLIQTQASNLDAEAIKAETEKLKAEIERQRLLEQTRGTSPDTSWQEYLMGQVDRLQAEMRQAQREAAEAQRQLLEDRQTMLQQELERLRNQASTRSNPTDRLEEAIQTLELSRKLVQMTSPQPSAAGPILDIELEKWRIQAENMREERRLDAEERRLRLQAEIDLEREKLAREQARLDEESKRMERFFTETMPRLAEIAQGYLQVIQQRVSGSASAAAGPVPSAAGVASPQQVTPPPGIESMPCSGCGQVLYWMRGAGSVVCPRCFQVYADETPAEEGVQEASGAGAPSVTTESESA